MAPRAATGNGLRLDLDGSGRGDAKTYFVQLPAGQWPGRVQAALHHRQAWLALDYGHGAARGFAYPRSSRRGRESRGGHGSTWSTASFAWAKTIHLSAPARAVLDGLPRVSGNPHVIVGGKTGAHLVNLEKPWRRFRKAADLDDVHLHDLRHSFASVGAGTGIGLPMIGKLLGHSQPQTTARYAHLDHDPVTEANEAVGRRIAAAMMGKSAEVAKLRGKAEIAPGQRLRP